MKRFFLIATVVAISFVACDKHDVSIKDTNPAIPEVLYSPTDYNLDMRDFALAVNEAINTNKSFRKLIKVEVDKMFDGDFNVLLTQIVDNNVDNYERREDGTIMRAPGNVSVRDLLNSSFQRVQEKAIAKGDVSLSKRHKAPGRDLVDALTAQYPKLQIAVPFLEEQLEDESYIPPVVFLTEEYDEQATEYLPAIKIDREYAQTAKTLPDSTCIVISMNERISILDRIPEKPLTPKNLTVNGIADGIMLEWEQDSDEDVVGYDIYRRGDGETEFTQIASLTTSKSERNDYSFLDGNAFGGQYEYYVVSTGNHTTREFIITEDNTSVLVQNPGILHSEVSNVATSVYVPDSPYLIYLKIYYHTSNSLKLEWSNEREGPYRVYRYRSDNPGYCEHIATTMSKSFIDNNLNKDYLYKYEIGFDDSTLSLYISNPAFSHTSPRDRNKKIQLSEVKFDSKADLEAVESWRGAPEMRVMCCIGNETGFIKKKLIKFKPNKCKDIYERWYTVKTFY